MAKRYQIWNKKDDVYTPSGAKFTAQEWIERYKWIERSDVVPVISAGTINGSMIADLNQMKMRCERAGVVFTSEMSNEDILNKIEEWEDEQERIAEEQANIPTAEERLAAAIEYQNLLTL